jgi:nucleoid-associated protein YgaU
VRRASSTTSTTSTTVAARRWPPTTVAAPTTHRVAPAPTDPSAARRPATHLVVEGDNLWRIASARLAARYGRVPSDAEVVAYWRRLIDANRATLRSGDPNLIFPGEVVALPSV